MNKFVFAILASTFMTQFAFGATTNNMSLQNQFGETSINKIVSVSSAGGAIIGAAIPTANVTSKLLTGYVSGAGTVAASDTLLVGIDKLNGNQVLSKATADAALPSASFTSAAVTAKVLTGLASGANSTILSTDTILQALAKLQAQIDAL